MYACVCVIAGWEQKRPQTWSVSREECDARHILHSSGWEVSEHANPLHTRVIITRTTLYSMHMSLKYVNHRCTTRAVQTINTHLILPSSRGWCSQTRSISFKTDKMYYRRARRGKCRALIVIFLGRCILRSLTRAGCRSQPGSDGSVVMAGAGFLRGSHWLTPGGACWRVAWHHARVTSGHYRFDWYISELHWYLFYVFVFCSPSSLCEVNFSSKRNSDV